MSPLERELQELREEVIGMMDLVRSQFDKSRAALINFDKDLAREVRFNDKRVDAIELKIDRDCENIMALFNPVAVDLRFVLASLKINTHLERIGDNVAGIAKFILNVDTPPKQAHLKKVRLLEMLDNANAMLEDTHQAYQHEDTSLARKVFKKDDTLNEINENASKVIVEMIKEEPAQVYHFLYLLSIIHKLERVGDLTKNLSEEIIFYIEAKVLKHKRDKAKQKKTE